MMNWCKRHDCFEICPYCMAELQQRSQLRDTTAERHPPKIIIESNPGTPADPRASQGEGGSRNGA